MGKLITVIGGAHQGKSYYTKQQLLNPDINCFVFDIQNAYGETSTKEGDLILNLPLDYKEPRARFYGEPSEFIALALKRKNTIIVLEEATAFFEGKTTDYTRRLMIDRYHKGNNIMFQFHSINSVPPRILEMTEIFVLFKTGDDQSNVKRKCAKLLPYFLKLQKMPDRSKLIIKNI